MIDEQIEQNDEIQDSDMRRFGPSNPVELLSGATIVFHDLIESEVIEKHNAFFGVAGDISQQAELKYTSLKDAAVYAQRVYNRETRSALMKNEQIHVSITVMMYNGRYGVFWSLKDIGSIIAEVINDVGSDYESRKRAGEFDGSAGDASSGMLVS